MKNQRKNRSILKVIFVVLGYVIIVVSVCGCKKSGLSTEQSHKTVFEGEETPTNSTEPIIVDTEVVLRIAESQQSFSAGHTLEEIEYDLRSRARGNNNYLIGRHNFLEFINPDPNKIQIPQIEQEMLTNMQQSVSDYSLGIEIEKIFVKQIRLSEEVQKRYNEMVELLYEHGAKE